MSAAVGSLGEGAKAAAASLEKGAGRLLYLDNLKTLLICLIIYTHAAQPYGMGAAWWVASEPASPIFSILISIGLSVNAAFVLGLFFLISAYFTPGSYDRKGTGKYLKDRLIRFGVPILFFAFLVTPVMKYILNYVGPESFYEYYLRTYLGNIAGFSLDHLWWVSQQLGFSLDHLWFVAQLLFFALCYIAIRKLAGTRKLQAAKLPGDLAIAGFILLMAISMFVVRVWSPMNEWILFHSLEPAHYTQYVLMFAVGIIAYRNNWLTQITPRMGTKWLSIGFASLMILFVVFVIWEGKGYEGGLNPAAFLYALYESILCVGMSIGLIALFQGRFNTQGKIAKTMADDSYTVYLFHIPVLVALQLALANVSIDPLFKFIIVLATGIPLSFLVSHLIRMLPYAKRVL